jgi:hypothetical protein
MAGEIRFLPWQRPAIHRLATDIRDGRRSGTLQLTVDVTNEGQASGSPAFLVEGPRDIGRIDASAIVRTAPPANEPQAETTKLVHVDFSSADFPWRYTLDSPDDTEAKLLPWVVLVVGTEDEISVNGGKMQIKSGEFLKDPSYNLEKSWLWAHVQSHDGREHSRLLAPRRLRPLTSYIAALVPAWDDRGKPSWSNAAVPQTLRALFSWRFQTTESGDFETLVAALQVKAEGDLGKVTVDYQIADSKIEFKVFGAISSRTRPADTDERIQSDIALKVSEEALADGAPAIGLPFYGRPWRNDPQTTKWGQQIFDDPRLRVPAGIGMWMGMEAQEQLLAAGIEQAGALDIARRRVASLVAGVQSNRSLQKRRLPESRLARLWVLAPVMARLPATVRGAPSGSVLSVVTNNDSPLPPALFSSAARRLLRRGGAAVRYIRNPGLDPKDPESKRGQTRDDVLNAANTCPPNDVDPRERETTTVTREKFGELLREYSPGLDVRLQEDPFPPVDPPRPAPCRTPIVDILVDVIQAAVDPSNVVDRVAGTVSPIDIRSLSPPELPIVVEYPTWLLLKERAREWLLPGFETIAKNSVIPLASNPEFVEAFLVGLNTQFKNELHWRKLADSPDSTPFTLFWGTISGAGNLARRTPDIRPITDWDDASEFGKPGHEFVLPGDEQGNRDLVIVFRTDLFRRYPTTQVYLRRIPTDSEVAADPDREQLEAKWLQDIGPGADQPPPAGPGKIDTFPIFQGVLAPDLVFFIFNVSPDDLEKFWVMLEEPPADLRFRTPRTLAPEDGQAPNGDESSSAAFAKSTLDHPTRVAISWASLKGLVGP